MRTIQLRMEDYKNFNFRVEVVDHYQRQRVHRFHLRNLVRSQIILHNPVLRRRIIKGITLVDQWGDVDKYFWDKGSSHAYSWKDDEGE